MVTILGGGGFVGSNLATHLRDSGIDFQAPVPDKHADLVPGLEGRDLGTVIYAIGLTADFRSRPFDTIDAHIHVLQRILRTCEFDSLTYLSSTRVYKRSESTAEDSPIQVDPNDRDDLYGLSKLMGESLCASTGRRCKVVRLSNVFGSNPESPDFISSVIRDATENRSVLMRSDPESEKDYISVSDACRLVAEIALRGKRGTYNLASGRNTTNAEIAGALRDSGVDVEFAASSPIARFPPIDTSRLLSEFDSPSTSVVRWISEHLTTHKQNRDG